MVSAGRARVVVVLAARRRRVREEAREVSIVVGFLMGGFDLGDLDV